jgi:hypothetical protein
MEILRTITHWLPRSIFGAVLAITYATLAAIVVWQERRSVSRDWISLKGIASYLVTFPVSFPREYFGHKLDFRRNLDMFFAIGVCAICVYLLGAGVGKIFFFLFSAGRSES